MSRVILLVALIAGISLGQSSRNGINGLPIPVPIGEGGTGLSSVTGLLSGNGTCVMSGSWPNQTITCAASGLTLQTNGTNNSTQTLFNLAAGTGISVSESSGTVTVTNTSGGGSIPAAITNGPDWPPASAGTDDDEFASGSLSGSWTQVNFTGATATIANSILNIQPSINSGNHNLAVIQKAQPGSTPWTIVAKINALSTGPNEWCGVAISDGTKFVTFGPAYNTSAYAVRYDRWASVTSQNTDTSEGFSYLASNWIYIKVTNDGTNLTFYLSGNGGAYNQVLQESKTAYLSATTDVGLFANVTSGTNSQAYCAIDFFRSTP